MLIVLLFRLLGGTTSGVLPVSVEEVSVSALQVLQHGQDFSSEGSDIAVDSGQRRTLTWLTADCAPTLESGHTGASDGGRGDVWRTEAAGTQPRAGHSTSGSLAPALAPPQLILTAGTLPGPCFCCYKCSPISLQRRPGRQPVARRCGEELVSSVHSCVITHHNSPPPARAWPGSSYTASCLTSTSPGPLHYCGDNPDRHGRQILC